MAAALGTMAGWRLADLIIGLAISAAILKVLHTAAGDISRRLMDRIDPDRVEHQLGHVDGIEAVDRVRVRWIGHELHAAADVALDRSVVLAATHDILEDARHHLLHTIPRLTGILLHANPAGCHHAHECLRHHDRPRDTQNELASRPY